MEQSEEWIETYAYKNLHTEALRQEENERSYRTLKDKIGKAME